MRIGVLDLKEYEFINDVMGKFSDAETEFVQFGDYRFGNLENYDVIIDRLSFQNRYLRQILMMLAMKGVYVINNPFSSSVNNKIIECEVCRRLEIKHPKTVVLPSDDGEWNLGGSVRDPDWDIIRKTMQLPFIMKPFDGFAWENVFTVTSFREAENLYNSLKPHHIMLLQEKIDYTEYFRVFCINKKDVLITKWIPKPLGEGSYEKPLEKHLEVFGKRITDATIELNKMLDFDVNAVEWCISEDGELFMIEAMNEVPDIEKSKMPEEYYWWITEKFSNCVREKLSSKAKNLTIFSDSK
ncbi:MAG: hypothetical protein JW789_01320 [Candidatus Aenigmarchaeota archaeon]|nr:hypothetical protein [Candidatus Aenigmarchaeota archaeon]